MDGMEGWTEAMDGMEGWSEAMDGMDGMDGAWRVGVKPTCEALCTLATPGIPHHQ